MSVTSVVEVYTQTVADFEGVQTNLEDLNDRVSDLPVELAHRAKMHKAVRAAQNQIEVALVALSKTPLAEPYE